MTLGLACVATGLGAMGDPRTLWISYPQAGCLGVMGDPCTGVRLKSLGVIWGMSGGHLRQVWGSPMTPHQVLPTTTNNYPRGWFSNATHYPACELWMNSNLRGVKW